MTDELRLRLAAMVESADDAIAGARLDGVVDYWNPAAERILGWSAHDVVGRKLESLFAEGRRGDAAVMIERARHGEAIRNVEFACVRADGTEASVSVTLSPTRVDGAVAGISAILRDVSERKELAARLAVTDRLASVGTLAAGLAHEINNPLAAAIANLEFIEGEVKDLEGAVEASRMPPGWSQRLREPLSEARTAADRIRQILRDLRLFSKPDENRRGPVDVVQVIESTLRMAWQEIRHRARLVKELENVPPVDGSEGRLAQVFLNLVVNAAHAIPEGAADSNRIRIAARAIEDGRVLVEIEDSGEGIAPENLSRIFEPFFTTRRAGMGTGLGLPICQQIVHSLGGEIRVESEPGKGTKVLVTLRTAERAELHAVKSSAAKAPAARRGRVLVVDDESMVGKAVTRVLGVDHHTEWVASGAEALEKLAADPTWDVVLCDLMMPQMSGIDLFRETALRFPELASRFVFLTGGAFTPAVRSFLAKTPGLTVIEKPFDAGHLRARILERIR